MDLKSSLTPAHVLSTQGARCLIPLRVRAPGESQRKFLASFSMSVSSAEEAQGLAAPDSSGNTSLEALLSVFFDVEKGQIDMSAAGSTRRVLGARRLDRRQAVPVDTTVQLQDDRDAFAAQLTGTHAALVAYLGVISLNPKPRP
jgi:hypothetical protein